MAASDRLKALDAKIRADEYAMGALSVYAPWLLDALPLIVAEVEAAERGPATMLIAESTLVAKDMDWKPQWPGLVAALAALDEALSSPTGGSP